MKDFNFDNMKNFNVSDEWADRVLITASNIKPTRKRNVRVIATCLSLVFVCAISVVGLNFSKNTMQPLPTTVVKETQNETEKVTVSSTTKETVDFTTPKESVSKSLEQADVYDYATEPCETQKVTPVETTPPPTPPHTQPPTVPTVKPADPTVPEYSEPTEPTNEDTEDPPSGTGDCIVSFSPSYLVGSGNIYCRIKDSNKETIGDKNLFSDQHLATFYSGFGSTYYYLYSPESVGINLEPGVYSYHFYNEHGVPICVTTVEVK